MLDVPKYFVHLNQAARLKLGAFFYLNNIMNIKINRSDMMA